STNNYTVQGSGTFSIAKLPDGRLAWNAELADFQFSFGERTFQFPIHLEQQLIIEGEGTPWLLKPPTIDLPQDSPSRDLSQRDWKKVREILVGAIADPSSTLNACANTPKYRTRRLQAGDNLLAAERTDFAARSLDCIVAMYRGGFRNLPGG